jgi:hypothetical protein
MNAIKLIQDITGAEPWTTVLPIVGLWFLVGVAAMIVWLIFEAAITEAWRKWGGYWRLTE